MSKSGFTYIEVIIVVGITVILTTMMFAVYGQFNGKQELKKESRRFVEILETSRKKASAGKKACDSYSGTYQVTWTTGGYTVTPGGCSAESTYTMPSTITLDAAGTANYKASGTTTAADCVIVQDVQSSQCRKVDIEAGGVVNEQIEADCSCP